MNRLMIMTLLLLGGVAMANPERIQRFTLDGVFEAAYSDTTVPSLANPLCVQLLPGGGNQYQRAILAAGPAGLYALYAQRLVVYDPETMAVLQDYTNSNLRVLHFDVAVTGAGEMCVLYQRYAQKNYNGTGIVKVTPAGAVSTSDLVVPAGDYVNYARIATDNTALYLYGNRFMQAPVVDKYSLDGTTRLWRYILPAEVAIGEIDYNRGAGQLVVSGSGNNTGYQRLFVLSSAGVLVRNTTPARPVLITADPSNGSIYTVSPTALPYDATLLRVDRLTSTLSANASYLYAGNTPGLVSYDIDNPVQSICIQAGKLFIADRGYELPPTRLATVYDALFGLEHYASANGTVVHRRAQPGQALSSPAEAMGAGVDVALSVLDTGDLGALVKQADGSRVTRISHTDGRTWS